MRRGFAVLFALSLLTFAGCAEQGMVDDASGALGERKDFKSAKAEGTSAAWTSFIEKYPQSSFRPQAEVGLEDAVWHETERMNTAGVYLAFAQNRPNHRMAGEARNRCKTELTEGSGTESDYVEYLKDYPDDSDARVIRQALKGVRYNAVRKTSNLDSYALFVAGYPGTPEASKLLPDVQRKAYQETAKTGTRLAYQFFLKRYPNAPDAPKAQAKLDHFGAAAVQQGNPGDLRKLLPQLRKVSPDLARRECQKGLAAKLRQSSDLYGAEAEEIRSQLRELAGSGGAPSFCSQLAMAVPPAGRQTAANAVRALAVLMERQQYLQAVVDAPDKIASGAQQTAGQAETLADSSESEELEIEALYGNMPADPRKPDETASKNAREAARRARRAAELVQGMSKKDEIADVVDAAKRQADLLIEILASLERPAGVESRRPARPQAVAEQSDAAPTEASRAADSAEPAPSGASGGAEDLTP